MKVYNAGKMKPKLPSFDALSIEEAFIEGFRRGVSSVHACKLPHTVYPPEAVALEEFKAKNNLK